MLEQECDDVREPLQNAKACYTQALIRPRTASSGIAFEVCLNAIIVFVFTTGAQWLVYHEWLDSTGRMRWIGSTVAAVVTGVLSWRLKRSELRQQALQDERLKTIAEVNHHIRNSLQILMYDYASRRALSGPSAEAVERIDWTLRNVLPGLTNSSAPHQRQTASGDIKISGRT